MFVTASYFAYSFHDSYQNLKFIRFALCTRHLSNLTSTHYLVDSSETCTGHCWVGFEPVAVDWRDIDGRKLSLDQSIDRNYCQSLKTQKIFNQNLLILHQILPDVLCCCCCCGKLFWWCGKPPSLEFWLKPMCIGQLFGDGCCICDAFCMLTNGNLLPAEKGNQNKFRVNYQHCCFSYFVNVAIQCQSYY